MVEPKFVVGEEVQLRSAYYPWRNRVHTVLDVRPGPGRHFLTDEPTEGFSYQLDDRPGVRFWAEPALQKIGLVEFEPTRYTRDAIGWTLRETAPIPVDDERAERLAPFADWIRETVECAAAPESGAHCTGRSYARREAAISQFLEDYAIEHGTLPWTGLNVPGIGEIDFWMAQFSVIIRKEALEQWTGVPAEGPTDPGHRRNT